MSCMHGYAVNDAADGVFSIDASHLTFGRGCLAELGALARTLGGHRIALFTDVNVVKLPAAAMARSSLTAMGFEVVVWAETSIEPTDSSFLEAARFYAAGRFDGAISLGGGSVIDTAKAALLYATWPASFLTYVNAPAGEAKPVPGALPWHIACPTTSGTGSELTGIAICDVPSLETKTGIASRLLRPALAVVDPDVTNSLPGTVVAASGFDVLYHALESFTARPHTKRPKTTARPMSQGANPWSDVGSLEALRLCGRFLTRAAADAADSEAREQMIWASSLAGIAFGNAGVHVPHAMAYAVASQVNAFRLPGYPQDKPMVPHGLSVVVNAPAVFRWSARTSPERHLEAAAALGAQTRGARPEDAGEIIASVLERMLRETKLPASLDSLGYAENDVPALVKATALQRRLLDNAPCDTREPELSALFHAAMTARPLSAPG